MLCSGTHGVTQKQQMVTELCVLADLTTAREESTCKRKGSCITTQVCAVDDRPSVAAGVGCAEEATA